MKNVILSEAKDLKWPKNEILRYTQNDKKQERCFFTQSDVPFCHPSTNKVICSPLA
ncbi:MAG: hypothetical protein GX925_00765 [Clostridiales bacterium]|nr:hypothetical protein [Clostridiales bacterium]